MCENMKQFLYLDNDIENSIIAQAEQGFITEFAKETETGLEHIKIRQLTGKHCVKLVALYGNLLR